MESLKSIEFGDHIEVYNYVAMDDVVVPIAAQFPHPNLADNLGVFVEHGYLHHDFIVGEKAREFAERLKGVLG